MIIVIVPAATQKHLILIFLGSCPSALPYSLTATHRRRPRMAAKKKSAKLLRCPTCSMLVRPGDEDFPFCSDRCRKIDLGKWAMGTYKISSPVLDPEVLEDLGELGADRSGGSHEH